LKERTHIIVYLTAPPSEGHKLIEGRTVVMEQKKERRIEERVRSFIRKYEKKMTHEAFRLLLDRIRDESVLESELTKLVTYVGDRRDIKSRDILAVGAQTHEESLISLFDALAKKDKKEAIAIFENLLLNGFNILAIHSFLVKQIRLLLQAKDMEEIFKASPEYGVFAKTFGKWKEGMELKPLEKKHYLPFQKPYYAFNLSKTSQRMSKKDLLAFFDMLAQFDVRVKSGTKHDRAFLEYGLIDT
jgi:DNA polymerase III delta subunit